MSLNPNEVKNTIDQVVKVLRKNNTRTYSGSYYFATDRGFWFDSEYFQNPIHKREIEIADKYGCFTTINANVGLAFRPEDQKIRKRKNDLHYRNLPEGQSNPLLDSGEKPFMLGLHISTTVNSFTLAYFKYNISYNKNIVFDLTRSMIEGDISNWDSFNCQGRRKGIPYTVNKNYDDLKKASIGKVNYDLTKPVHASHFINQLIDIMGTEEYRDKAHMFGTLG